MKDVYKILNIQDKMTMKHFYNIICDTDLDRGFCAMRRTPCACTGCVENTIITGYLNWIKPYNHVMPSIPKHLSTLPSYVTIINGIFPN